MAFSLQEEHHSQPNSLDHYPRVSQCPHLSFDQTECPDMRALVYLNATKDILAGKQITIAYADLDGRRKDHRAMTLRLFRFSSMCDTCTASDADGTCT